VSKAITSTAYKVSRTMMGLLKGMTNSLMIGTCFRAMAVTAVEIRCAISCQLVQAPTAVRTQTSHRSRMRSSRWTMPCVNLAWLRDSRHRELERAVVTATHSSSRRHLPTPRQAPLLHRTITRPEGPRAEWPRRYPSQS
jgi:hypothetical protein